MTGPAFLSLPPIKNAKYASAREIVGIGVRTGPPGEEPPAAFAPGRVPDVALPILDGAFYSVLFRQPSAQTDYGWARPWFDARAFTQVRLIADVETAGAAGSKLVGIYSANGSTGWVTPATAALTLSLATAGRIKSGWLTLADGARTDVVWSVEASGGDAAASPVVKKVHFQFRQATVVVPPRGIPIALVPIMDIKVEDRVMSGSVITSIPDATGNGNDTSGGALGPTVSTGEFGSIEAWVTANTTSYLTAASLPSGNSASYYCVVKDVSYGSGGGGILWCDPGPGNLKFVITPGGHLTIGLNDTGGNRITTDDPISSGKHIFRLVFDKLNGLQFLFIDGQLVRAHDGPLDTGTPTLTGWSLRTTSPTFLTTGATFAIGGAGFGGGYTAAKWARMIVFRGAHFPSITEDPDGNPLGGNQVIQTDDEMAVAGDAIEASLRDTYGF